MNETRYTTRSPVRNKDGNHVILNLSRGSQGHFHSFQMNDCCLTSNQQFSAISWREQVNFKWDDDEVRFVLDQYD
jgi:hypothetical protein